MIRSTSIPYIAPFGVFMGFVALHAVMPIPDLWDQIARIAVISLVLFWFSGPVLDFRLRQGAWSILIGVVVFLLWIGPDVLFPHYRQHWLFENAITGSAHGTLSSASHASPLVLALRSVRAVIIVPIVEELFWRAWLMRWLISEDLEKVSLGAYTPLAFSTVAVLFASEHGSYWDVGLVTGIIYNWWMLRTKTLGDLILAHATTNACLSAYVIAFGKWEYWL